MFLYSNGLYRSIAIESINEQRVKNKELVFDVIEDIQIVPEFLDDRLVTVIC